ncbi:EAL domain-containing response regulator [Ferrimonas aestuarii]|uniref:EAL domain-containing protein n=1 Tax=Ferrimonas aestuarii TaxID=2569539 RepID=A0A4V6WMQ4_9GAMM|nr:EAL domain-containing response regulator [Ferrimonas aestuarii]TKB50895.1 EAL domain-containing protein [Ferrimonas aestuarii]
MKGKRVAVVIDDSVAILMAMELLLPELGFHQVMSFSKPRQALEYLKQASESPEIVFTDLNMPDFDGMDVIRELGQMGYRGGVCLVSEMEQRVLELAAELARKHKVCFIGNISKPITSEKLRHAIVRLQQLEERNFTHFKPMSRKALEQALSEHRIFPYYQPKVSAQHSKVSSIEVLARISEPGKTDTILPGHFIPTAINSNLINQLTKQLLTRALEDLPVLCSQFGSDLKLSVNLSPSQLTNVHYVREIEALLASFGVKTEQVVIEITEEFALKSCEQLEALNRLRIHGFGVSMDDFGTGYTNLHQLRALPFTEVKIDRSLINNISQDSFSQVVVRSLATIAESLDIILVAEGIEEMSDLDYLERHYPDMLMQGFLLCKPKPCDALMRWHQSWQKVAS